MPPRRSASNFNGTNANLPAAESEDEIIMTLMAAAAFLHVHPSTVYRLLRCQQIPAFKVASDWRFTKSGLIH
jgi:excisionase family DNA binding protein